MAQLIEHDKKKLIARRLLVAPIVIPLAILALPFIAIALASKWIKESYRKSSLSPSPTEAQIQPEPPVQRPVGEKVIRKQREQPMTFETAHSTYYSKVMQLIEKTLVELIDKTTQGDMLIMHENVYARLSKLTPSVNWKNTITFNDKVESCHRALQVLTKNTNEPCSNCNDYEIERILERGFYKSNIILINKKYSSLNTSRLYGDSNNNETMSLFHAEYAEHDKYIAKLKIILNRNDIFYSYSDLLDFYIEGIADGNNSDDHIKQGMGVHMAQKGIVYSACNTAFLLNKGAIHGFDFGFLAPALVELIERPTISYLNEMVMKSAPYLPWIFPKEHSVLRVLVGKNEFNENQQSTRHNQFEMVIETTNKLIHIKPYLIDSEFQVTRPPSECLKIYDKNGSSITAFDFETEASSEGIDTMIMFLDENILLIDSFAYKQSELIRAIKEDPKWNDYACVDLEKYWLKIQGKLINKHNSDNRIEE
ncbi:hypothetical protein K3Z84_00645 [Pseudomonas aeruginosa]|nr:hypothetical protein [Pseudomonas aeruginosa]